MQLRLTKRFTFEMAHALPAYPGKCRNIHGHSYKLLVTVQGPASAPTAEADGMVLDFARIKEEVQRRVVEPFDHALVLPRPACPPSADPSAPADSLGGFAAKIVWVDFPPTTENLLLHFAHLLHGAFPAPARLCSLRLYETETSCAELIL